MIGRARSSSPPTPRVARLGQAARLPRLGALRAEARERQAVNRWIRTSGEYDGVIDFDRALRDPGHPLRLLPAYDSGDHLHPNDAGMAAMADAVPLRLFRRANRSTDDSRRLSRRTASRGKTCSAPVTAVCRESQRLAR